MFNRDQLIRVCWHYYHEGLTQKQVAEKLGLSRLQVLRLLQRALKEGVVEIKINVPGTDSLTAEKELRERTDLDPMIVVPSSTNIFESLAHGTSYYLNKTLKSVNSFGIGMGRTLQFVAAHLDVKEAGVKQIVSLLGNAMANLAMNPHNIGTELSNKLGAEFYSIWAPVITQTEDEAKTLRESKFVSSVLGMGEEVDLAITGVGSIKKSSLVDMGFVSHKEFDEIKDLGAVGEILGRFYTSKGLLVETSVHSRVIAVPLPMKCPVVAVAGGKEKADALMGAIKGSFISGLVTDEETARVILQRIRQMDDS